MIKSDWEWISIFIFVAVSFVSMIHASATIHAEKQNACDQAGGMLLDSRGGYICLKKDSVLNNGVNNE